MTVNIYGNDPAPKSGQNYTFSCNISDETNTFEHRWKRNGTIVSSEQSLYFNPLRLSDGGEYTCEAVHFPAVSNNTFDLIVESKDLSIVKQNIMLG